MTSSSDFYLVTDPGTTPLRQWQWLSERGVDKAGDRFGLSSFTVQNASDVLDDWINEPTSDPETLHALFRMIILYALLDAPQPCKFLRDCGAPTSVTIADLYGQAVARIQRLGRLRDADAPEIVRHNERRMIGMTARALICAATAIKPPRVAAIT